MWFGYVQRRSIYAIVRKIDCTEIKGILKGEEDLREPGKKRLEMTLSLWI